MADDLLLSGGGSTVVASASLLELAGRLRVLAAELDDWRRRLRVAARSLERDAPGHGVETDGAERCLDAAAELARELDGGVRAAAERYGSVERELTSRAEQLGAAGGAVLGSLLPALAALAVAMLPQLVTLGLFTFAALGGREGVQRSLAAHRDALSDPRFVAAVRLAVSSSDNALLAALGAPGLLAWLGDDRRGGFLGLRSAATVTVAALSSVGLVRETPVRVLRASSSRAAAPADYGELAARIPGSTAGSPQVRVERYSAGGRASWIVYVGGTIDTSFRAGAEPFDDTSNLHGVAGLDPGSVRVAEQALREAGARPGDRLLAVGYSQGGIVATDLVKDAGYAPVGLVTFGSPTAGVALPDGLDDIAVEHVEDVIPALGGLPRGADQGGLDRMLVRRQVLDDLPARPDERLPAHDLERYRDTARELDACTDARLRGIRETLAHVYGGAEAEVSLWRGERVAPGAQHPDPQHAGPHPDPQHPGPHAGQHPGGVPR